MGGEGDLVKEKGKTSDKPEEPVKAECPKSATDRWNIKATQTKDKAEALPERTAKLEKQSYKSALDGQYISMDRDKVRTIARKEIASLSPEAKRKFNDAVNRIFWKINPEFDPKKTGGDGKIDMKNQEHRPYAEKYQNIKNELAIHTGRDYWKTADVTKTVKEFTELQKDTSGLPEKQSLEADAKRQDRIWPEERALTGKLFKEHVITETTIYGHGASKKAAFRIAEKLTPTDLDSEEMRTPDGEKGLGALHDAMYQTGDYFRPFQSNEKLSEAEQKTFDRISEAWLKVRRVLRGDKAPVEKVGEKPTEIEKNSENFKQNFPEFSKELKKKIEKDKNIKVEKLYHRPFRGKYEEVRAVLFKKTWINDPSAPSGTIETKHDVCLGGIDLSGKGESISGSRIEKHGTAEPSLLQLDDILLVGTIAKATGKLFYKGVMKGIGKLSPKIGISTASTIGKELGEEIAQKGARGADSMATTGRVARAGAKDSSVDALGKTQPLEKPPVASQPVDEMAETGVFKRSSSSPEASFNDAATTRRMSRARDTIESPPPEAVKPWDPPARHGYDEYLGKDLHNKAKEFGMQSDDLAKYVDDGIYRRLRGGLESRRAGVQAQVANDLAKLEAFGAKGEIARSIKHGYSPDDVLKIADRLKSKGVPDSEIGRHLKTGNDMLDNFSKRYPEVDLKLYVRKSIDEDHAIADAYYKVQHNKWYEANKKKWSTPQEEPWPGREKYGSWFEGGKQLAKEIRQQVTSRH
jgi:hypothetical protein